MHCAREQHDPSGFDDFRREGVFAVKRSGAGGAENGKIRMSVQGVVRHFPQRIFCLPMAVAFDLPMRFRRGVSVSGKKGAYALKLRRISSKVASVSSNATEMFLKLPDVPDIIKSLKKAKETEGYEFRK